MIGRKTIIMVAVIIIFFAVPVVFWAQTRSEPRDDPWSKVEKKPSKTNHSNLFEATEFKDGPAVTKACLKCHPGSAKEIMQTSHWT